jgi:hypothetical protein
MTSDDAKGLQDLLDDTTGKMRNEGQWKSVSMKWEDTREPCCSAVRMNTFRKEDIFNKGNTAGYQMILQV